MWAKPRLPPCGTSCLRSQPRRWRGSAVAQRPEVLSNEVLSNTVNRVTGATQFGNFTVRAERVPGGTSIMRTLPQLGRVLIAVCLIATCGSASAQTTFVTFESGQVRPLALSPNGRNLFAANTPDGQLEIFNVGVGGISHAASIPVGMEPVALAARSDNEVWVVNFLSDSISIVDVASRRVVRTLLVGDEPRDIVFAGPGRNRAFITTAHRGQQRTNPSIAAVPGSASSRIRGKPGRR